MGSTRETLVALNLLERPNIIGLIRLLLVLIEGPERKDLQTLKTGFLYNDGGILLLYLTSPS